MFLLIFLLHLVTGNVSLKNMNFIDT